MRSGKKSEWLQGPLHVGGRAPFGLHFSAPFLRIFIVHLFDFLCDVGMFLDDRPPAYHVSFSAN